jgi:hypothetical protein
VQEAYEGRFSGEGASASVTGEAGRRPIETLGRRRVGRVIVRFAKRVRGTRAKAWVRLSMTSPERLKPKGAPSGRWTNPLLSRRGTLGRVETQEPRLSRAGSSLRR